MSLYLKISLLLGGVSFIVGLLLMFISMGLPLGNLLLAPFVGAVSGKMLLRARWKKVITKKQIYQAAFIIGLLNAIGVILPLMVLAFLAPKGSTITQEFPWFNTNIIPATLNNLPMAMVLASIVFGILIIGLTMVGCLWATRQEKL